MAPRGGRGLLSLITLKEKHKLDRRGDQSTWDTSGLVQIQRELAVREKPAETLLSPKLDQFSPRSFTCAVEPVRSMVTAVPFGCQLGQKSVIQLSPQHAGFILCLVDVLHVE